MKMLVKGLLSLALIAGLATGAGAAEEGAHAEGGTPHYPIHKPHEVDWSFAGPFGHYDKGQLQRGLKIYTEVCSACHSMNLVSFRTMEGLGYSEAQVKAFAVNYEVEDGPNDAGDMFTRKAVPSDHFPAPFANTQAAAASNNGAAPPDFSLIAKARGVTRGFPQFVFDIFTQYQEGGPDYIYSLLTGYQEPPAGVEVPTGTHYNPYFVAAASLAMAPPLSDGQGRFRFPDVGCGTASRRAQAHRLHGHGVSRHIHHPHLSDEEVGLRQQGTLSLAGMKVRKAVFGPPFS
jgi:ubiquinol-cytochrome c reductase cytochrome c1 subunit